MESYRWWTVKTESGPGYRWIKLGPLAVLWGRFMFRDDELYFEIHVCNRMVWCNYR